jgi:hypothetical protein
VVTGIASGAIDLVRRSLGGWTRILGGGPVAEQVVAVNRELLEAERCSVPRWTPVPPRCAAGSPPRRGRSEWRCA